jgi:hypothetical protein
VSVDGAEEDGVDNRVEAPTWVPDGGSDSTAPGQQSDGSTVASPGTSAGGIAAESSAKPSAQPDGSAVTRPHVSKGATAGTNGASEARDWSSADGTPPVANGSPPVGNGSPQPGPLMAGAAAQVVGSQSAGSMPGAMDSAANAARGLAAKVAAPFSGLGAKTKPKPKTRPQPKKAGSPGLPPRPGGARPQARITPGTATGPQTRRAQLRLDRVEPWSVMKFSFLISLIGWVVLLIAVAVLYFALSKLGVFTSIEHTVGLVTTSKSKPGSNAASWFKASRVLGYTMLVGAINVVLITALATIGAVLYNLVTMLTGGVEVTLRESD